MKSILKWFETHNQFFYRSAIFLVTVGIIAFLFPREGRFPYEYQKSKPWMHPDLFAPFDFPVLKTIDELREEKDSLMKQFRPFFNYAKGVDSIQISRYEQAFDKQWKAYLSDSIDLKDKNKKQIVNQFFEKVKDSDKQKFFNLGKQVLTEIYRRGILELNDQIEDKLSTGKYMVVITNNVGEERDYSQVLTPKTAYEFIIMEFDKVSKSNPAYSEFITTGFLRI